VLAFLIFHLSYLVGAWGALDPPAKVNGLLISATTVFFLSSYFLRETPIQFPKGLMETVYPFCCMTLPLIIYHNVELLRLMPLHHKYYPVAHSLVGLSDNRWFGWNLLSMSLTIAGNLITLLGMMSLRRSFSIMVEARQPVVSGLYSYVRHPLYLGEVIATAGVLMFRFSSANAFLFLFFVSCQGFRAALEEKKLRAVFPEYREYCRRTGAFLPLFRRAARETR
jgi:protein-S-isoprenylcysteine O-methyltransferase Ste14